MNICTTCWACPQHSIAYSAVLWSDPAADCSCPGWQAAHAVHAPSDTADRLYASMAECKLQDCVSNTCVGRSFATVAAAKLLQQLAAIAPISNMSPRSTALVWQLATSCDTTVSAGCSTSWLSEQADASMLRKGNGSAAHAAHIAHTAS